MLLMMPVIALPDFDFVRNADGIITKAGARFVPWRETRGFAGPRRASSATL
jgi:hypothetical protein